MKSMNGVWTGSRYVISPKLANNECLAVLLFLISLALLIIVSPILIIFGILRTSARVILKLKHGKNYGGLVESEDVMWKTEDVTNPLIHIFTIQQSKITTSEDYFDHVKRCLHGLISGSNAQKLTSVCKFFMGYPYYLNNQLTIDDICNKVTVDNEKEFLDKSELTDILGGLGSKPMPKENSGLFEVLVIQKPLKQIDHDIYQYAVIVRVDHIVSDGINLINFLLQNCTDDQEGLKRNLKGLMAKFDTSNTKKVKKTGWQRITQIAKDINTFMVNFIIVFVNQIFLVDHNCLHGPKLSGKKLAVYVVEKPGEDLVEAVKQIKRKVTGSTFSSVMLTAISRAVGRHMQEKDAESPNYLSVLITLLFSVPDMERTPTLASNFSVAVLDLPLLKKSDDSYCQIGLVEKRWNEVKEKPDFLINYMMFKHVFGLIPIPLLTLILKADKVTMSISNLPGIPKLNIFRGQQLENVVFFTPHRNTAGVGFTLLTYDNKFQMGLMVDKVLISSKEEVQSLLNDVFKEIRRMHQELGLCPPGLSKQTDSSQIRDTTETSKQQITSRSALPYISSTTDNIVTPILIFFVILRTSARLILKLKHGKNYGGLVESEAAMWKIPDITNPLINIFTIQQSKISTPEAFLEHLKQCLHGSIFESNAQKLTSICKFFMGYPYYLNNQLTIDDICNKVTVDNGKEFLDQSELTDILGDLGSKPMPKENSGLFEVLVIQKPLKQTDPDTYQYAVILRVDHIVADGINLTSFLLQNFGDDQDALKRDLKDLMAKFKSSKTKISKKTGWQSITQIAKHINTFMVNFITVFVNQLFLADYNCLHGPQLSGKKFAVYAVEKQGEDLVEAVKQIKRRVTGSTFSSVILTAISRAIGRHMQKRQAENPNFVSVLITALLSVPDFEKTPTLANNFSAAVLHLPLLKRSEGAYCQIGLVEKYWSEAKEKPDFLVNYLMVKNVFGLIPIPLLAQLLKADTVTMTVSNLPGVPKLHIFGGQQLEKLVFFAPHRGTVGIGFTLITYDNKFQMGLMIDKVLICSKEEAQSLLDDVLKEIRRMHEELDLCSPGLSKEKGSGIRHRILS